MEHPPGPLMLPLWISRNKGNRHKHSVSAAGCAETGPELSMSSSSMTQEQANLFACVCGVKSQIPTPSFFYSSHPGLFLHQAHSWLLFFGSCTFSSLHVECLVPRSSCSWFQLFSSLRSPCVTSSERPSITIPIRSHSLPSHILFSSYNFFLLFHIISQLFCSNASFPPLKCKLKDESLGSYSLSPYNSE